MSPPSESGGPPISNAAAVGTNVQARSNPAPLGREQDRVSPVGDAELAVDVVDVAAHRALGQPEVGADLLVALALGQPPKRPLLHLREGRWALRHPRPARALQVVDDRVERLLVQREPPSERDEHIRAYRIAAREV